MHGPDFDLSTRAGIEAVYRRHAPHVYRRALRLLGSEADAHEVVQDVFLALFERPSQFGARSALTTYLYGMTTHACLNLIRKQKNRRRLLGEHVGAAHAPPSTDGEVTPDERFHLRRQLERMPELLARVVLHASVDDLEHAEIARIVGCSRRQVGKLLARAAAIMREKGHAC